MELNYIHISDSCSSFQTPFFSLSRVLLDKRLHIQIQIEIKMHTLLLYMKENQIENIVERKILIFHDEKKSKKYDDDKLFNCQENHSKLWNGATNLQPILYLLFFIRKRIYFSSFHASVFFLLQFLLFFNSGPDCMLLGCFVRCNYAILIAHIINHFFLLACPVRMWLIPSKNKKIKHVFPHHGFMRKIEFWTCSTLEH